MTQPTADALARLQQIIAALRDPQTGCPWDLQQDHRSMAPPLLEEAYELIEAIDTQNDDSLREELGDLLFVALFHAQLAHERGAFTLQQVLDGICDKMIDRHPHVFGDDPAARTPDAVKDAWARRKRQQDPRGVLGGVPDALPALQRAHQLTARAATVGFDWENTQQVMNKVHEELDELKEALALGDPSRVEDELGDALFALVNLARHARLDAEMALQRTNRKFLERFNYVEEKLRERGSSPDAATLDEMDALWNEAKRRGIT